MENLTNTYNERKMIICQSAYNDMVNFIGTQPAESGGALFGYTNDFIVRKFVADKDAITTGSTYTINADYINKHIDELGLMGLNLIGMGHSHPKGSSMLSSLDFRYFENLLQNYLNLDRFFAPVLHTIPDGGHQMFAYELTPNGKEAVEVNIEIVPDHYRTEADKPREVLKPTSSKSYRSFDFWQFPVLSWMKKFVELEALVLLAMLAAFSIYGIIKLGPVIIHSLLDLLS
ncbi:MAG: Mov34/MPN/PAD-1 family protein [Cytophagales bacterium]